MKTNQFIPPPVQLFQMITGFWASQCLYAAAKLDIADYVTDIPKHVNEIAKESGTHPEALYRVMRALASVGVFAEKEQKHFVHTDLSEILKSDLPVSMKYLVLAELGQEHYRGWGNLVHAVKTGEIAFNETEGESVWQYYSKHPEDGLNFMKAMTGLSEGFNHAVVPSYDWMKFKKIVDVGGGNGSLLAAILNTNKDAKGILFDEPYVTNKAHEVLSSGNVTDRVEVIGGNFFQSVPEGGDAYILKFILHDWNDERALTILKNIHTAMHHHAKLLIVEGVLLSGNEEQLGKLLDINMLVMTGGMERTEEDYRNLLGKSGFKLLKIHPTPSPMNIIEAVK
ncbi:MAG: methyltransferase [Bacteroidia bacterium]